MIKKEINSILLEKILLNYTKEFKSLKWIIKQYPELNMTYQTLGRILRDNDIKIINRQNIERVSESIILEEYKNGKSINYISKKYKTTYQNISKKLKLNSINVLNSETVLTVNHNLFNKIDIEEKAYWLGFLYADGNVSLKRNVIEISLQLSDSSHIEKYKKFLKSNNKILYCIKSNKCRFLFSSKQIKKDLIKLNCTPRKSLTLNYPDKIYIPNNMHRHIARGYFDGDGCLTYGSRHKIIKPFVSFCGTKNYLENTCKNLNISNYTLDEITRDFFIARIKVKDSVDFLKLLYEDCNVYLERKYNRYKIFKENNYAVESKKFFQLLEGKNGEG